MEGLGGRREVLAGSLGGSWSGGQVSRAVFRMSWEAFGMVFVRAWGVFRGEGLGLSWEGLGDVLGVLGEVFQRKSYIFAESWRQHGF